MRMLELRNIYQTVTTAATRVRLTTSSIKTPFLIITAEKTNTGHLYVGDASVSSTNAFVELGSLGTSGSIILDAERIGMKGYFDLSQIYLDVSVNTDGGYFGYFAVDETD